MKFIRLPLRSRHDRWEVLRLVEVLFGIHCRKIRFRSPRATQGSTSWNDAVCNNTIQMPTICKMIQILPGIMRPHDPFVCVKNWGLSRMTLQASYERRLLASILAFRPPVAGDLKAWPVGLVDQLSTEQGPILCLPMVNGIAMGQEIHQLSPVYSAIFIAWAPVVTMTKSQTCRFGSLFSTQPRAYKTQSFPLTWRDPSRWCVGLVVLNDRLADLFSEALVSLHTWLHTCFR